ncbi:MULTISPECIES: alkaline phosphatase D family protein [unclassified Pseudomonas]|uniref:alkaline phosphatase D family protein n=1 Tax=unclassified Pseudomonas TaxID=196821 RepID=UPI0008769C6B|nr:MULTISPECIES: alkaline phosphatase D family protein [unclassified Pseudomonas]SCZ65856.1 alkaline phosphatase D [Pseudomonas sp. NFPP17]SDA67275.1 alkaline phosphatase D [Pseudomonas sp. NFPP15]SEL00873.1 alkaline phosphatase D [Pseudomonas sp. NFPP18]SFA59867.1 alkaline phosphatase D [Pseudomonas sp. NFPP13]SFT75371.1 alkaline phosphatase D [Pseudomonas sp. NFPP25]
MSEFNLGRRRIMQIAGAGLLLPSLAPAVIASVKDRPQLTDGVQSGDLLGDKAMIWSRSDRPARMVVEWDTRSMFSNPRRFISPLADARTDFTARVELTGLPANQAIFYRVTFEDAQSGVASEPWFGHLRSAPSQRRDIRFVWSGDTVGQGFGINPDIGGMRIYEAMRLRLPDFFIHSGDTIYADGPVPAQLTVEDGRIWRNLTTEAKSKVAETLDEYRGNYRYNLMDESLRRFNAEVPQIWQWDDHEVVNNWSPSKQLDERYVVKDIQTLVGRARQAWLEYSPMRRQSADGGGRIYRKLSYGPLLDVFVLDMRSYRGPNDDNLGGEKPFLGREQLDWLKRELKDSSAQWKVVAADMPIGLGVPDGEVSPGVARWEAIANGDPGPAQGRELEIAELLAYLRKHQVRNHVWLTADVHYCAAHHYHPDRAAFQDFEPFWEFVAGPLNAGSFGPNVLDKTFGPEVVFQKAPPAQNTSPFAGFQFFGEVQIDGQTAELKVILRDLDGVAVYEHNLQPA